MFAAGPLLNRNLQRRTPKRQAISLDRPRVLSCRAYEEIVAVTPVIEQTVEKSNRSRLFRRYRLAALNIAAFLIACEVPAYADDDDIPLTPGLRVLAICSSILVAIWLLAACYRAARPKAKPRTVWEKPSGYPPWLDRWLAKMQESVASRRKTHIRRLSNKQSRASRK